MKKTVSGRMERLLSALEEYRLNAGGCPVLLDVGCDHGMIGCAALERNLAERVIFSDLSAESLQKAERLSRRLGFSSRAEFVCGDGLVKRGNAAIVAGMGGREISEILLANPDNADFFILQPMKNGVELRDSLIFGGFRILSDSKIEDGGRFYDLMTCERGADTLTPLERRYGRTNLITPNPAFAGALKLRLSVVSEALCGKLSQETAEELRKEREEILSVLGEKV